MSTPLTSLSEIRAGVIGTGFIGPVHVEALRRLGVKVVAICDLPESVEAAARRLGIPRAFSNHRDLLSSPEVDVVHIAAPNRLHYRMSLDALAAGKHCICEKPLAMNSRESAAIVERARRSRCVFAVNYNVRFYPAVLQLRALVAEGALGQIIHVNGSYMQDWLFKETDYNWRLLPEQGGKLRAVADIGTHWVDTIAFILGDHVKSVFAHLGTWHKRRKRPLGEVETFSKVQAATKYATYAVKTEDFGQVLLQFKKGTVGNLAVSQVAAGRKNSIRFEIYGSKKSAWWCSENPETLMFGNRDSANEIALRNTPSFAQASPFMDYPAGHVEGFPDTFKMLFRSVYTQIASGGREQGCFAKAMDGHREVLFCEAVMKSNRSNSWVTVPGAA